MSQVDLAGVSRLLCEVHDEGRGSLYQHECYHLLEMTGAEAAPPSCLVPAGEPLEAARLDTIPGSQVVLKVDRVVGVPCSHCAAPFALFCTYYTTLCTSNHILAGATGGVGLAYYCTGARTVVYYEGLLRRVPPCAWVCATYQDCCASSRIARAGKGVGYGLTAA